MNITLENKIKILEYKLLFEQEKKIIAEFEEGNSDLNYRLSFFKKKVNLNSISTQHQQDLFDNIFPNSNTNIIENIDIEIKDDTQIPSNKNNNIDKWVKNLYIKISKSVHPDITMHIKSETIKKKFDKLYLIAKNGYENNIFSDIIMVAYDLDIELSDQIVNDNIVISLDRKKDIVNDYQKKLGWKWFHVPDDNKDAELRKILNLLGFEFSDEKIKDAIKSRKPERKAGQRPQKINVKNKKLN